MVITGIDDSSHKLAGIYHGIQGPPLCTTNDSAQVGNQHQSSTRIGSLQLHNGKAYYRLKKFERVIRTPSQVGISLGAAVGFKELAFEEPTLRFAAFELTPQGTMVCTSCCHCDFANKLEGFVAS